MDLDFIVYNKLLQKIKIKPSQTYKFWQELITSTYTYQSIVRPRKVINYGKLLYQQVSLPQKYIYYSYLLYFLSVWQKNTTMEYCQYLLKELIPLESCVICMENNANQILMPCTHIVCCDNCISEIQACPICRSPVETYRKV